MAMKGMKAASAMKVKKMPKAVSASKTIAKKPKPMKFMRGKSIRGIDGILKRPSAETVEVAGDTVALVR